MVSQVFVYLLMLDALWIACGLVQRRNMWSWIVLYWLLLTAKNYADFVGLP